MGVSSTTNTEIYNGDAVTVSFAFPFYFFATTNLFVYIYDTIAKNIALKTLGVDYAVTGVQNSQGLFPSGGNVVFASAPSATKMVIISRFPIETQTYNLSQNGAISSTALVQQMDYLTLLVQSLQDQINRCIKLPAGYGPDFDTNLPADLVVTQIIGINGAGDGLVLSASGIGPTGPTGPTGPAGPTGASGLAVSPASSAAVLAIGSPINNQYVPCDATAAPFNVTLPAANLAAVGQVYQIKKVDSSANAVTILPNGSDTFLTTALLASLTLDYQGKSYTLVCRAAGFWDVI